jgi:hypothetical protein
VRDGDGLGSVEEGEEGGLMVVGGGGQCYI